MPPKPQSKAGSGQIRGGVGGRSAAAVTNTTGKQVMHCAPDQNTRVGGVSKYDTDRVSLIAGLLITGLDLTGILTRGGHSDKRCRIGAGVSGLRHQFRCTGAQ